MKTIREFLEEQINEQLIQAVVSGRRTGEGPSKVKLRPVELKGQIFYQASMTEGTKVYHKNFTREEMIAYLEHAMEEFRQLQATGRSRMEVSLSARRESNHQKQNNTGLHRMRR